MSKKELTELYLSADAVVIPSRGESFNMPVAEAMFLGVPVITTAYGGQTEFCFQQTAWLIDYSFDFSHSHLRSTDSLWVEPDAKDLGKLIQQVMNDVLINNGEVARRAEHGRRFVSNFFTWSKAAEKINYFATNILKSPPRQKLVKLAWISTWGVRCGIAEYSQFLLQYFDRDRFIIYIYADSRTEPDTQPFQTVSTWQAGAETDITRTLNDIAASGFEAVIIQYHKSFFNLFHAVSNIAELSRSGTAIIFTFHETHVLETLSSNERRTLLDHLRAFDRILVHTLNDLKRFKRLGLVENVSIFPHGVMPIFEVDKKSMRRTLGIPSGALTLGSYGFFLPHKGIYQLIEAFTMVKKIFPESQLILVNAEYPIRESANEISRCRELVQLKGIENSVHWFTDFKAYEESLCLLGACDMVIFPYQNTRESASGAIRIGLASDRPVLTSPLSIFEELEGVTYQLSGTSPEEIFKSIVKIASDEEIKHWCIEAQRQWVHKHEWKKLSLRLQNMIICLIEDRHRKAINSNDLSLKAELERLSNNNYISSD